MDEGVNIQAFEAQLENERKAFRSWLLPTLIASLLALAFAFSQTVVSLSAKKFDTRKLFPEKEASFEKNTEYPKIDDN